MLVTVLCRHGSYIKVLLCNRAANSWKKSCISTDTDLLNTIWNFEVFVFHSLMDSVHDLTP